MDSEVNDPRHVWYCAQCVRKMREMVGCCAYRFSLIFPSDLLAQNTFILILEIKGLRVLITI